MNSQELRALQESYSQVYELDEVSSADYTALAKTKKPRSKESIQARYHAKRLSKPEPETGKKSPRPYYPGGRKGMTQSDRDWSRGADEYGHSGYDGEGGGGSLPKGKKLERQKKTGVSAEGFDRYNMLSPKKFQELYTSMYEARDDDAKEMRRLAAAERRAGKSDRTDSKTAEKYAGSEAKSAEREDKKSKGKHIHGYAIGEAVYGGKKEEPKDTRKTVTNADKTGNTKAWQNYKAGHKGYKAADHVGEAKDDSYLETDMNKRKKNNEKAIEDMNKTKANADMVKAARKHFEEFTSEEKKMDGKDDNGFTSCWKGYRKKGTKMKGGKEVNDCVKSEELEIQERALDAAETGEKERLVKGMKKSAADFKNRYGKDAKSVMYATATKKAKEHMDTSKSDRRYSVEEVTMEEETDLENRKKVRKPSELAKKAKLDHLITKMKEKKEKGEN